MLSHLEVFEIFRSQRHSNRARGGFWAGSGSKAGLALSSLLSGDVIKGVKAHDVACGEALQAWSNNTGAGV